MKVAGAVTAAPIRPALRPAPVAVPEAMVFAATAELFTQRKDAGVVPFERMLNQQYAPRAPWSVTGRRKAAW